MPNWLRINGLMYTMVGYKLSVNNPQRLANIKYLIKKSTLSMSFEFHIKLDMFPRREICR